MRWVGRRGREKGRVRGRGGEQGRDVLSCVKNRSSFFPNRTSDI